MEVNHPNQPHRDLRLKVDNLYLLNEVSTKYHNEYIMVKTDDYFKSYFKSKYQEDAMPIHYSIFALLAVILILLVYLCIKVSN